MFDLFRSRDKAVRILLGGLLVVVAISMLSYLVPNYDTGNTAGSGAVVASIGSDQITAEDVQRLVQNTMRGKQLPPDMLPIYLPQLVDQMVVNRAIAYEAARLGFQVSDLDVSNAIRQIIPSLFPDGRFVGKDAYAAMLGQQQMTIADFETDLRRQILITRLKDVAIEGTVVTQAEIEHAYKQKSEKIKIQYVKLTSDQFKKEVAPSDAEMKSYYQANLPKYQTVEKKNLVILVADQAKMEQTVSPSDADLQRVYSQNQAQYHLPETSSVRHILFMTQGKPPADETKIKAQADDVLKQLKAGTLKFEDAVKKYSEDPASKDKGGEYPAVQHGQMVKEFDDASFNQKPGDLSLVKTSYGYHIIQVESRQPAHQQTFDEVKGQLAADWKKTHVSDAMQKISDQAQAMLQKDPLHPDKVAAALNMEVVHADNVEPNKPIPGVGASPDFDQAVSTLKEGQVSQAVALPGNKVAVAEVTGVVPSRPSTFDEVESQVRDALTQSRLTVKVQEKSKELVDKAKSMGGDLEKAAKAMNLKVETTADGFSRADTVPGFGSANYAAQAFSSPDGTIVGPLLLPDATVVAKVVEHIDPDPAKLAAERDKIRDDIKSEKAKQRDQLFEAGLKERLIQEGKIKIHQDVINRIIAGYRS
jgi:peptidyl-prolyl cis-trans isomerase D